MRIAQKKRTNKTKEANLGLKLYLKKWKSGMKQQG